ncbi:hypothetical protein [Lichenicoccus sp.]|uniref:hypothetical protein n=1 Tax=Lichenicoccus sp. TaxID=2781899 RepID=UPI003D0A0845
MPSLADGQDAREGSDQLAQENITDLARIIVSEAGGENETAQAMVGWTVINRMKKQQSTRVSEIWAHGNYAHGQMTTGMTLHLAARILDGSAMDISQGATHFYSPKSMPNEGDRPSSNTDARGGLESVPGVTKSGRAIRNFRPSWAKNYSVIRISGIQDKDFKFYNVP